MRSEVSRREALSLANFDCYTQKRQETALLMDPPRGGGGIKSMSDQRIPHEKSQEGGWLLRCSRGRANDSREENEKSQQSAPHHRCGGLTRILGGML